MKLPIDRLKELSLCTLKEVVNLTCKLIELAKKNKKITIVVLACFVIYKLISC